MFSIIRGFSKNIPRFQNGFRQVVKNDTERKKHFIHVYNVSTHASTPLKDVSFVSLTATATFLTCATWETWSNLSSFSKNTTNMNGIYLPSFSTIRDWISVDSIFGTSSRRHQLQESERRIIEKIRSIPLVPPILKEYLEIAVVKLWFNTSPEQKTCMALISVNVFVYIAWLTLPRYKMMRYFTDSTFGKSSLTMLTSAFSHMDIWHIGINMFGLYNLGPSLISYMGTCQFIAFYITTGIVANLGSRYARRTIGSITSSLGASGALFGCLGALSACEPDMRVSLVFMPNFDFTISAGVLGMMIFDFLCILSGRSIFDHFGHLSGTLFGLFYVHSGFGEELWSQMLAYSYEIVKFIKGNWR